MDSVVKRIVLSVIVFSCLAGCIVLLNYYNIIALSSINSSLFSHLPRQPRVIFSLPDTKLTEDDLNKALLATWGRYTDVEKNDQTALNTQKELLLEQTIVKLEAKKMGIITTQAEIDDVYNQQIRQVGGKEIYDQILQQNGWTENSEKQKIALDLLKKKVEALVVKSRTYSYASIFIGPDDPQYKTKKVTAEHAMEVIRQMLQQGKSFTEIKKFVQNNKSFQYILIDENQRIETKDIATSVVVYNEIFSHHTGEITKIIETSGGTITIAKIIQEVNTPYDSFSDWLTVMKKKYNNS